MSEPAAERKSCARIVLCVLLATLLPASVAEATPVATSISAAAGHTCATMATTEVDCWGRDYITDTTSQVPLPVAGIRDAVAVQAGFHYNCVLLGSHKVFCWGDGGFGQLGGGTRRDSRTPVSVLGISGAVAISVGGFHACALLAGGGVECWGRNLRGALGDGSLKDSSRPVPVTGITDAVAVSAGYGDDGTCALLATGSIRCWGSNAAGQLGDGTTNDSALPVAVQGVTDAVSVAIGGDHACAVRATGEATCWGANDAGQLGDGTTQDSLVPVRVEGIGDARAIATARRYSCALALGGLVYCWGHNPKNQLGDGLYPLGSLVPVVAVGITEATSITTSSGHACALLASGGADCWGYDDYGQLGDGPHNELIRNPTPVLFAAAEESVTPATPSLGPPPR
jgi:alpha-tubulin suppressor-like RCC1 family protein